MLVVRRRDTTNAERVAPLRDRRARVASGHRPTPRHHLLYFANTFEAAHTHIQLI